MKKVKKTKIIENKKFKTRKKPKLFQGANLNQGDQTDQMISTGLQSNPYTSAFAGLNQLGVGASKSIRGEGYDYNKNVAAEIVDPNAQFKGNKDFKDVALAFANPVASAMTKAKRKQKEAEYNLKVANAGTAEQIQRGGMAKGGYIFGGDPITGEGDTGKAKNTASTSPFTVESWKKQGVLDSLNRGQMLKGSYADFNKHFGISVPAGVNPNDQTFHINPGTPVKGKPVMFHTVTGETVTHDKMGQNAGGLMTFKKGGKMKRKHKQIDPFLDDGQEGKFNAPSLRLGGPVPMNQQKAFYTWMLGETCDEDFNTKGEQRTHLDPDREAYPDKKKKKASGGKLLANKLGVIDGGDLQPVSNDAVEVKADNPSSQDSVELQDAFVDDGEIIDRKNRVFSEVLGYAKQAKKLERQKSKNVRFSDANERIEQKLDALFQHQEQAKKQGIAQPIGKRKKEATAASKDVFAAGGKYRPTTYERKGSDEVNIGGRVKLKKFDPTVRMKEEDKVTAAYGTVLRMKPEDDLRGNFLEGGLVPAKDRFIEMSQNRLKRNSKQQLTKASFGGGGDLEDDNIGTSAMNYGIKKMKEKQASDKKSKKTANLKTAGNLLATYGPNVAAAILQSKLKGPASPQLEQFKALDRVRPDAQLAAIDRDTLNAVQNIKMNTAQAGDIASAQGNLLAKKLAAQNEVYGQNQALNAQIQAQEAGLNVPIGARNADRSTIYRQGLNDFSNLKTRLTSENIANVGQKYMLGEKEKNQIERDKFAMKYIGRRFKDSGVVDRNNEDFTDAELSKYGIKDGGKLYGHFLNRSRERDELAVGGKLGYKTGGIHIKKENRGKFTATKKRTGKTTEQLKHSKNPLTRKRATFALNASKWSKKKK